MNLKEANQLLGLAKANYSYAFKQMSNDEKVLLVKSWAFVLQDIPADIVTLAFMKLLATSKWLPTPAEIREQVKKLYYESVTIDIGEGVLLDERSKKTAQYITDKTCHMRGEYSEELSLGVILNKGYGQELGCGRSQFQALEVKDEL